MRFFNFFLTYMVQKYQNEISPIFYYGKKLKTSGKLLKIPYLQPPDWGQPYWMTLYKHIYTHIFKYLHISTNIYTYLQVSSHIYTGAPWSGGPSWPGPWPPTPRPPGGRSVRIAMVTRTPPGWSPGISTHLSTHIPTHIFTYLLSYLQLQPGPGDGAGLHPGPHNVPAGPHQGPGQEAGRVLRAVAAVIRDNSENIKHCLPFIFILRIWCSQICIKREY